LSGPRIRVYPPHLDAPLTKIQAEDLASDPINVAKHAFFPFLQRDQKWTKFARKGFKGSVKGRPIRYASRRDSYIYGYYRSLLSPLYESELKRLEIDHCILAYRRIPQDHGTGGKCNIHFAYEAFETIRNFGNCDVFALDIHHFFENLDHEWVKQLWWRLLGKPSQRNKTWLLPKDHFQVFKAITKYSYIDVNVAYKALGLIGEVHSPSGPKQIKYTKARKDFPKQICTPKVFRQKLLEHMEQNLNPFGIPQGSPISDLLANLYMLDFDKKMNDFISSKRGKYYRYSDDILVILPTSLDNWQDMVKSIKDILNSTAPRLEIKDSKTQVYRYESLNGGPNQTNEILNSKSGADGMEYLGFRYDGSKIFFRNSTISGIHRKITAVATSLARRHLKENSLWSIDDLISKFNYSLLIAKFGRVKDFDISDSSYTSWTFWTYVRRSSAILGELGSPILRQFKNYKKLARSKARKAIESAYKHKG